MKAGERAEQHHFLERATTGEELEDHVDDGEGDGGPYGGQQTGKADLRFAALGGSGCWNG